MCWPLADRAVLLRAAELGDGKEILACEICRSTLAVALLAFVSYAVSDWVWDVIMLLRAHELLVGYAVMPHLVGGLQLHVIMDVRIDERQCHLPNQSMNGIVTFIWNMISCIR